MRQLRVNNESKKSVILNWQGEKGIMTFILYPGRNIFSITDVEGIIDMTVRDFEPPVKG